MKKEELRKEKLDLLIKSSNSSKLIEIRTYLKQVYGELLMGSAIKNDRDIYSDLIKQLDNAILDKLLGGE